MPVIQVNLTSGRSTAQKREFAAVMTREAARIFELPARGGLDRLQRRRQGGLGHGRAARLRADVTCRTARLGVDIGGTFTDLVLMLDDGAIFAAKVASTPAAPEAAVLTGLDVVLDAAGLAPARAGRGAARHHGGLEHAAAEAGRALRAVTTRGVSRRAGDRAAAHAGDVRPALGQAGAAGRPALPRRGGRARAGRRQRGCARWTSTRCGRRGGSSRRRGSLRSPICFLNSYANPANERAAAAALAAAFPAARGHRLGRRAARGRRVRADLDHGGQRLRAAGAARLSRAAGGAAQGARRDGRRS